MSAGRRRWTRKTNPISRREIRTTVRNEPNLPLADCGLGTDLRRDACPAASRLGPATPIVQNEPNFLSGDQGRLRKTKPIPATLSGTRPLSPPLPRGPAPSSRFCKTNPISAAGGRCRAGTPNPRRAKARKTNPIGPGRRVNAQNEPNSGRTDGSAGADCAKRTQFRPGDGAGTMAA
jgi:hypothetical protein